MSIKGQLWKNDKINNLILSINKTEGSAWFQIDD